MYIFETSIFAYQDHSHMTRKVGKVVYEKLETERSESKHC